MAKHGQYPYTVSCKCDKCTAARARESRRNGGNWNGDLNFNSTPWQKNLPNGTTLYGPEGFDRRNQENYHGHYGDDFHRTPHSTIGSAAIGDPHTYDEHKNNRTERWPKD